jgi:hypothetical protein
VPASLLKSGGPAADAPAMRRTFERSPWRWLAALTALTGLFVLATVALGGEAHLGQTIPGSILAVGGLVLFLRLSVDDDGWERIVHGPTARRFLAVGVVAAALLGLAASVVLFAVAMNPGR